MLAIFDSHVIISDKHVISPIDVIVGYLDDSCCNRSSYHHHCRAEVRRMFIYSVRRPIRLWQVLYSARFAIQLPATFQLSSFICPQKLRVIKK